MSSMNIGQHILSGVLQYGVALAIIVVVFVVAAYVYRRWL